MHDFELVGDLLQNTVYFPVALYEPKLGVFQIALLREVLDEQARLAKIVSWQAGE